MTRTATDTSPTGGLHPPCRCPACGEQITRRPEPDSIYACPQCTGRFHVLCDADSETMVFVDRAQRRTVLPLHLPRGSVRALIALTMAATAAILVIGGRDVPGPLASLLLTIVGFYFGFRVRSSSLSDRVYDPTARRDLPLYLPSGVIRTILLILLLGAGAWLLRGGRLMEHPAHLELYVLLVGLIVGHYVGRAVRRAALGHSAFLAHLTALAALALAALLAALFLTGRDLAMQSHAVLLLCAAISFYYGSRS